MVQATAVATPDTASSSPAAVAQLRLRQPLGKEVGWHVGVIHFVHLALGCADALLQHRVPGRQRELTLF